MNLALINSEETAVLDCLKAVIDPELMVNIVDLGLVYSIEVNSKTNRININLTLTSPGCPMGDVIMQDIENTLYRFYPSYTQTIQLVWEPNWTPDLASEEGKFALTEF